VIPILNKSGVAVQFSIFMSILEEAKGYN